MTIYFTGTRANRVPRTSDRALRLAVAEGIFQHPEPFGDPKSRPTIEDARAIASRRDLALGSGAGILHRHDDHHTTTNNVEQEGRGGLTLTIEVEP